MDQIILQFNADTSGIVEVATAMNKLGQITEQQLKEITDLAKKGQDAFKKQTTEIAKETSALGKLNQSLKQTTQTIAGGAAKSGIDKMTKGFQDFRKGLEQGVNEGLKEFGIELDKSGKKTTTLTGQLRELRNQLAGMDEGSAEFQKLSIEAARLQDKIGDVGERVRVLSSDTFSIDAMVDGVRGLTAAFTVAQSASALFGEENEDLQKALLKVQAATGLLIGVQEIANQLKGQGAAKLAILTAAQKLYGLVVEQTTGKVKVLNAVLTGGVITLALAGIALLIANWDKLKGAITGASDASEKFAEAEIKRFDFLIKKNDLLGKSTDELRQKQIQAQIDLAEAQNDGAGIIEALRAKELLGLEITQRKAKEGFEAKKLALEQELELVGKNTARELKLRQDLIQVERQIRTAGEKFTQDEIYNILLIAEKKKDDLRKQFQKNRIETQLDVDLDANVELNPNAPDPVQAALDEFLKKKTSLDAVQLDIPIKGKIDLPDFELTEESKRTLGERISDAFTDKDVKQTVVQGAQEIFDAVFEISQNYRDANVEAQLTALDEQREHELNNRRLTEDQRAAIDEKFNRRAAKIKEEQFKANKKAAIAQALINGALAVTTIIATTPKVDFGAATYALLALNAVSTAASVATIAAQPIPKFKKGTMKAPPGLKLVGEEGPELINDKGGYQIIPHKRSMEIMHAFENNALNQFSLDRFAMPPVRSLERVDQGEPGIDYDKLSGMIGKQVGRHIKNTSITVTDSGTVIQEGNRRRNFLDKYHTFQ